MKKVLIATMLAFGISSIGYAADVKKTDCTQKKNANKIECKKAPEPKKKVEAKKPAKVERKAPAAVQKKAEEAKK
jgi:hypothetical protein